MMSVHDDDEIEEIELDLSEDDSLPWLESDEDDEEPGGIDTRQIVVFAAFILTLLAAAILAVWYFTNQSRDPDLVPDGSTIAAPEGPYKEKPEDPGGKEFAGTGNVAPAVGEGETPEAVVATDQAPPAGPSVSNVTSNQTAAGRSGVAVQVAAYGSRARAEAGWQTLRRQTDLLSGVRYRVVKGEADIGTVYRLQAMAEDLAAAEELCRALKADGIACQVKR